jgi:hypothetical protein
MILNNLSISQRTSSIVSEGKEVSIRYWAEGRLQTIEAGQAPSVSG